MTEFDLLNLVLLPIGLGLLGFVEPCSIGSGLVFVKYLEGMGRIAKLSQVTVFALTRGLFISLVGAAAVGMGTIFLGFQKAAWIVLGTIYAAIGLFCVLGKAGFLMRAVGPRLSAIPQVRGSKPRHLIGDTSYGTAEMVAWIVEQKAIEPHVALWEKGEGGDWTFGRCNFVFDQASNSYHCPSGKLLKQYRGSV